MLETLAFGDIEIERASDIFSAGGKQYANGSYVIKMQQPFSGWAKTLLERQNYPDLRLYPDGPPKRPYDVTAQTLPLLMGVAVDTIEQPFQTALKPAGEIGAPANPLLAREVYAWKTVNEAWNAGKQVWRNSQTGDFQLQ